MDTQGDSGPEAQKAEFVSRLDCHLFRLRHIRFHDWGIQRAGMQGWERPECQNAGDDRNSTQHIPSYGATAGHGRTYGTTIPTFLKDLFFRSCKITFLE
ncbi:hypothetical protein DC363_16335 [Thalassorhabdomicrobium marinisediminis]|uniref:Uncharacterized protein n=1 Tax=Thalassorhabdomicrobium marinisediminis TaxID=2170577 RepID=A0A2T7FSQ3_9RHOB|nr:hypothetical protein DC363_16335 [Thalassorhabdomicrobium marinisediminis]